MATQTPLSSLSSPQCPRPPSSVSSSSSSSSRKPYAQRGDSDSVWRIQTPGKGEGWVGSVRFGEKREDSVEVDFPFQPYPCQEKFMEKVIDACVREEHALLESPTGTGKTLCLLCASLAYVRKASTTSALSSSSRSSPSSSSVSPAGSSLTYEDLQRRSLLTEKRGSSSLSSALSSSAAGTPALHRPPRVVYASRTHTQLQQVVREARRTSFFSASPLSASPASSSSGGGVGAALRAKAGVKIEVEENGGAGAGPLRDSKEKRFFGRETGRKMKVAVLGSRDNLCVHAVSQKLRGAALNAACKKKLRGEGCKFYSSSVRDKEKIAQVLQACGPMDVEDLKACGTGCSPAGVEKVQFCPFYTMRDYQEKSDLVLLPYNYLLDPSSQLLKPGSLANSILIIDEAHNVEQVAEDASSFELRQMDIGRCINALGALAEMISRKLTVPERDASDSNKKGSSAPPVSVAQLLLLQQSLAKLDEWMSGFELSAPTENLRHPHALLSLEEVAEAFTACSDMSRTRNSEMPASLIDDVTPLFSARGKPLLDRLLAACMQALQDEGAENEAHIEKHVNSLDNLRRIFNILYAELTWQNASSYRVYLHDEGEEAARRHQQEKEREIESESRGGWSKKKQAANESKESDTEVHAAAKPRCLAFWSMSPAPAFASLLLQGARSIICTSGTLAPLLPLAQRLGTPGRLKFSIFLENDHVVGPSQLFATVLSQVNLSAAAVASGLLGGGEETGAESDARQNDSRRVWNDFRSYKDLQFYHRQLDREVTDAKAEAASPPAHAEDATKDSQTETLLSTFQNRNRPEYLRALGFSLLRICTLVGGGVLCFFASYAQMHTCITEWKKPLSSSSSSPPASSSSSSSSRSPAFFGFRASKSASASRPLPPSSSGSSPGSIFGALQAAKEVFVEPANSRDMPDLLVAFQRSVQETVEADASSSRDARGDRGHLGEMKTGAVLLAVCKGKAAEGIDFSDHACRAVVICGLPLASFFEPRVQLKRMWLDDCMQKLVAETSGASRGKEQGTGETTAPVLINGRQWYEQEARRAVNQAVGRVVRHAKDFGVVVFLDKRFSSPDLQKDLPRWVRRSLELPPASAPLAFLASRVRSFFSRLPAALLHHALAKMNRSPSADTLSCFVSDLGDSPPHAETVRSRSPLPPSPDAPSPVSHARRPEETRLCVHGSSSRSVSDRKTFADAWGFERKEATFGERRNCEETKELVCAEQVAADRRRAREAVLLSTGRKPFREEGKKKRDKGKAERVLSLADLEAQSTVAFSNEEEEPREAAGTSEWARIAGETKREWRPQGEGEGVAEKAALGRGREQKAGSSKSARGGDSQSKKAAETKAAADLVRQVRRLFTEEEKAAGGLPSENKFFTFCICMRHLGSVRGKEPAHAEKGYREVVSRLQDLLLPLPVKLHAVSVVSDGHARSEGPSRWQAKKEIVDTVISRFVPAAYQRDLRASVEKRWQLVQRESLETQNQTEHIPGQNKGGAGETGGHVTAGNGAGTPEASGSLVVGKRGVFITVAGESEEEKENAEDETRRPTKKSRVESDAKDPGEEPHGEERRPERGSLLRPAIKGPNGKIAMCLICGDDLPLHRSLNCGHEFCLACWTEQLKNRLECPICRARTRAKHLVPA
ncbi:UNVERIFIED_CONTAM: helicase, putative [Hammondia hammondi]|eukprot:XP_008886969.1 helicase, putative [Hammondia hammondi]